jgi:predicted RNase H-like nuclease (RuvC/YqgF family)
MFHEPLQPNAERFPLPRYTAMMYRPRVSNAEVRALIQGLTLGRTLPSGAAVRSELKERYGSRGGVARIYRLLAQERVRLAPTPVVGSVEALQQEIELLRGKLVGAEEREYAHQRRWAEEVDQLRMKLATLAPLEKEVRISHASDELLRHRLQAAERRAAALEQQLYELTRDQEQGRGRPADAAMPEPRTESLASDTKGSQV